MEEELVQEWQEAVRKGIEGWEELFRQTTPSDFPRFWKLLFDQTTTLLTQMISRGATPELLDLWKQLMDRWIEAWSLAIEKVMASEEFARLFFREYLNRYLAVVTPFDQGMRQAGEASLKALGLPSRTQITEIASQLSWVETRIEELEGKIEQVLNSLASLEEMIKKAGAGGEGRIQEGL